MTPLPRSVGARHRSAVCRLAGLMLALACLGALPAHAQAEGEPLDASGNTLRKYAAGALGVLGLSIVPNETASAISLKAGDGDIRLVASQFGYGFTVSDETPLYLEGFLGVARYDPKFVVSDGGAARSIAPRWNSISGTVGVGWDIPVAPDLALRPIGNFALGHIESDIALAARYVDANTSADLDFLEGGKFDAVGYGGALMLDWERYRPDHEIDVELRYTYMRLESFGGTSSAVEGHADVNTLGLWSRLRVPSGYTAFGGPLRWVGEVSGGYFFGAQAVALQSDYLGRIGGGIEFDLADATSDIVSRTRLLGRYLWGENLQGYSVGIAVSF